MSRLNKEITDAIKVLAEAVEKRVQHKIKDVYDDRDEAYYDELYNLLNIVEFNLRDMF